MLRSLHRGIVTAVALAGLALPLAAAAQDFPARTITIVVGYAPGGTGDFIARLIGNKLSEKFGRTVVVENRAGASGLIAAQGVANAAPDGYTILAGQTPEIAINPTFLNNGLDPARDLKPIALGGVVPLALVVPKAAPYDTVKGLLDASHSAKGLLFASAGTGTPGHFAGEVLRRESKGNMTHVPYKGAAPALADLLGSHVDFYFPGTPAALPYVKSGQMKMLAVSTARRTASAPDVPTVTEATGIKDFDFSLWGGFFAPHGTPDAVVATLNGAINAALALPDIKQKMAEAGADIIPMSVEQFTAFMQAETDKYRRIIQATGIKPE
ncbi:MAG TPA: tripartite tricarboxylate transporter substrate binding protein [Xanthobacteraceae bacterium]|nr:tripartite tricarboxylate transporter substrate binding protein [Xanthobacteraceae bacterium]